MKTSRIARETAKVSEQSAQADTAPQRQTRSFAASLTAFAANNVLAQQDSLDVKEEDLSDSSFSLSTAPSVVSFDIEDAFAEESSLRKRKRGLDSPFTTVTATSSATSIRTSPWKAGAGGNVKKAKRQPAKRIINDQGEIEIDAPAQWEEVYHAVKEMRKTVLAPVDTMGCETLAEDNLTPRVKSTPVSYHALYLTEVRTNAFRLS